MVMQPEEREFCTALGTAVKQVNSNAGTFALSFSAGQHLFCSSGDCLSDSFSYLKLFYICLEEIILSLRISSFVFIVCLFVCVGF